ncbi:MAG: hypothetical protein M3O34_14295 [Chloroflexota bacterium]|nr:hypothetical protein [Chloroflexota bacterium]
MPAQSEGMRVSHCVHSPFPQSKDHVLLPFAGDLDAADAYLRPRLTDAVIKSVVGSSPAAWLGGEALFPDLATQRAAYVTYLRTRLDGLRRRASIAFRSQRRGPVRLAPRLGDDD